MALLDGTTAQIVGSVVLYLSSTLSAGAGVGGGALNVPIFYLVWGFTYRESVVMSLATLMGNYLCQVLINLTERHPIQRDRPLIYWDAVLILLPAELAGANIGVILSAIFPDTLCVLLGMVVLVIAFVAALDKGVQLHEKESMALLYHGDKGLSTPLLGGTGTGAGGASGGAGGAGGVGGVEHGDVALKSSSSHDAGGSNSSSSAGGNVQATDATSLLSKRPKARKGSGSDGTSSSSSRARREKGEVTVVAGAMVGVGGDDDRVSDYLDGDSEGGILDADVTNRFDENEVLPDLVVPWPIIAVVLGVWVIYACIYVGMEDSEACGWVYFTLLAAIYPLLLAELVWGTAYLIAKQRTERRVKGDIQWAEFQLAIPALALLIGVLSSLLGIGGGELMGPLMLYLKVLATVSPATTSMMSFLNTSSSLVHYMTLGQVDYLYAAWGFGIGAAGGITGRLAALYVTKVYGRASYMIFTLCAVLVVSFGLYIYDLAAEPLDFTFTEFCA